ncbi:peptide deformylase [Chloroflexota bacterium]
MAIRKILEFGEPILEQKAKRVRIFDNELKKLADDMLETMRKACGVGLAAPQVGTSLRLTVIEMPDEEPIILVNPEITEQKGERKVTEGCLSYPGYRGETTRSELVKVKACDLNGDKIKIKADGLLAQALEHEIDHLNGILYINRLIDKTKLYRTEMIPDPDQREI